MPCNCEVPSAAVGVGPGSREWEADRMRSLVSPGVLMNMHARPMRVRLTQYGPGPQVILEGREQPGGLHYDKRLPPELHVNAVARDGSETRRLFISDPACAMEIARMLETWALRNRVPRWMFLLWRCRHIVRVAARWIWAD